MNVMWEQLDFDPGNTIWTRQKVIQGVLRISKLPCSRGVGLQASKLSGNSDHVSSRIASPRRKAAFLNPVGFFPLPVD